MNSGIFACLLSRAIDFEVTSPVMLKLEVWFRISHDYFSGVSGDRMLVRVLQRICHEECCESYLPRKVWKWRLRFQCSLGLNLEGKSTGISHTQEDGPHETVLDQTQPGFGNLAMYLPARAIYCRA